MVICIGYSRMTLNNRGEMEIRLGLGLEESLDEMREVCTRIKNKGSLPLLTLMMIEHDDCARIAMYTIQLDRVSVPS